MEQIEYPHSLPQQPSPLLDKRQFELKVADALDKALVIAQTDSGELFATPAEKGIGMRLFEQLQIADPVQRGLVDAAGVLRGVASPRQRPSPISRSRLLSFSRKIQRGHGLWMFFFGEVCQSLRT